MYYHAVRNNGQNTMNLLIPLIALIKKLNLSDITLRIFILSSTSAIIGLGIRFFPEISRFLGRSIGSAINITIFSVVLLYVALVFLQSVVGRRATRQIAHVTTGGIFKVCGWLAKVTVMTLINLFLFIVRIVFAALGKDQVAAKLIEASTHLIERQADLLLKPTR